jgi:hypothetical protein
VVTGIVYYVNFICNSFIYYFFAPNIGTNSIAPELEGSLSYSQKPATDPYTKQNESTLHSTTSIPKIHYTILSSHLRLGLPNRLSHVVRFYIMLKIPAEYDIDTSSAKSTVIFAKFSLLRY